MAWITKDKTGNSLGLTTSESAISKQFINNHPTHIVIEVVTTGSLTGDLYLYDSADNSTFNQVATTAVDATATTVWRLDARTTPLREIMEVRMKLDSGTGTVSHVKITGDIQ